MYLTGNAHVLTGDDASQWMPLCKLGTRIQITSFTYVKQGIYLRSIDDDVQMSPYNPPVKYLREEMGSIPGALALDLHPRNLKLVSSRRISPSFCVFRFECAHLPVFYPGQFVVVDCSSLRGSPHYMHMNNADPTLLNDDFVRTWTISCAPPITPQQQQQFEISVKLVPRGHISPFLFQHANNLDGLKFLGIGGEFSCFHPEHKKKLFSDCESRMIWLAAGSGVTPFLSMCDGLKKEGEKKQQTQKKTILLLSLREEDVPVAKPLMNAPFIDTKLFVSDKNRRINDEDIASLPSAQSIWLCGPPKFMENISKSVKKHHPDVPLITESYKF